MATALQQQLAAIAANSTHQLDLRAQKGRHSKSLLFEPRDAATQSFDTIYQICYEGFEELCVLDSRFSPFGLNLFSEQSKDEDRTRMMAKENRDLDQILESFLGLVSGRLLLKPAVKAVEWLVRRFRVQEYNCECFLLTFLPYHTSHTFPAALEILPEQLPSCFKWLHPYVNSRQNPPRHAILSAAISNHGFFWAFSRYTLKVAKAKHHSAVLLGFWASIAAQAVNGMIDASRSGRDSIRKQREEDLLLRVLPILQSALGIKGIPELYLGACMIMTILATKASLEDSALDAMLEAVAGAWTDQTLVEGLTCLAVIADEKQQISLPASVTKALLKFEEAFPQLMQLCKSQRSSKLVTGFAVESIILAIKKKEVSNVVLIGMILEAEVLPDQHTIVVLEKLVSSLTALRETDASGDVCKAISGLLTSFTEEPEDVRLLEKAVHHIGIDVQSLPLAPSLFPRVEKNEPDPAATEQSNMQIDEQDEQARFEAMLQALPRLPMEATSFLESHDAHHFQAYADAFHAALISNHNIDRFGQVSQLHKSDPINRPESLTFLARLWSSNATATAKVTAMELARTVLNSSEKEARLDLQALLPYILTALSDASPKVRKAAANVCQSMGEFYGSKGRGAWMCPATNIYGASAPKVHWLSSEDAHKFLANAVLPVLEDCIADGGFIGRMLVDTLSNGAQGSGAQEHNGTATGGLKKALRADVCTFLASHAVATPAMRVKLLLLQILSKIGRFASQARSQVLVPFVKEWVTQQSESTKAACKAENVAASELDQAAIGCLTHRSKEEVQLLKDIAAANIEVRAGIFPIAFARLRHIFPMSTGSQMELAEFLLDLALAGSENNASLNIQDEALETLRALALPTDVLVHILETIPNATNLRDQPPSAKKQRTSRTADAGQLRDVDQNKVQAAVRRITLVLELVEASKPEQHPPLLQGLFHTLSELRHYKALTNSELVYIHQILLGCILAVITAANAPSASDIDRSVIRTDLIVECVRTTSSTQIHNTALLIVSSLASYAPELVLHSVMPLFTFMSSTLLRQSDSFSAHVTDQTVAKIVPPLAASLKKKGKNLVSGVAELLLSFTAAFEHIPLHRRAGLFEHLVSTLGADETLFAVVAMLVERYSDDGKIGAFVADLVNRFGAVTALRTAEQYLELVFDALKPKRGISETLLVLGDKHEGEVVESVGTLLEGLASVLQGVELRRRVAKELAQDGESAEMIHSIYASLLEKTMQLTRDLASNATLKDSADSVLLSVLGLMPTKDFIKSSAQLMQTGSDQTRQQVFRSLGARVSQAKRGEAESRKNFIDVLPNCSIFITEDQPVATRHAAVSCIDQISEKYGKTERSAVLEVAERVAGDAALGSEDGGLRVISILSLASMIEVLEDECISILPSTLSQTLAYLESNASAGVSDPRIRQAGFGFLNAVLDHTPWMLSQEYLERALKLADQATTTGIGDEAGDNAVQQFCSLTAKGVGASELFATIERTWNQVCDLGDKPIQCHLNILHQAIQHHTKATVTKNARTLFDILLEAFDLRRKFQDADVSDDELVDLVDRVALDTVLKLNDATFRPFFMRLVEWATNALPRKDVEDRTLRLTSLYSFSLALSDQLKSIVTSYVSFLLESASQLLKNLSRSSPAERRLLDLVLQTLSSSFLHDQDDLWQTPAHFDAVALPLINQLTKAKHIQVSDQVIPTITDLAAAVHSSEHYKTMNRAIMGYMRDGDASVRLAAVKCERSITERVNLEWLALLPEMLPFISELQEDDDEDVERETLRWVRQIEEVTGESLEGMLA